LSFSESVSSLQSESWPLLQRYLLLFFVFFCTMICLYPCQNSTAIHHVYFVEFLIEISEIYKEQLVVSESIVGRKFIIIIIVINKWIHNIYTSIMQYMQVVLPHLLHDLIMSNSCLHSSICIIKFHHSFFRTIIIKNRSCLW
jgi:hypothetical protein